MARPDQLYNPVATVAPNTQQPGQTYTAHASPESFGGAIGNALSQGGAQLQNSAARLGDALRYRDGLINETLATNAESQYVAQAGTITGQFRAKEGLEAVQALPDLQKQLIDLRTSLSGTLPQKAAIAFNTLSVRHEGNYLNDANSYAASQVKAADNSSAKAAIGVAIGQSGDLSVATDDQRFKGVLQDSDFQIARMMNNQGYGADGGTGMRQSPDGALSFNDSPAGQKANSIYQNMRNEAHGSAWENRLQSLASQNVVNAYLTYQNNRNSIPGETQVKLDAYFAPRIRSVQSQLIADKVVGSYDQRYQAQVSSAAASAPNLLNGKFTPDQIGNAIHGQESGGAATSPTSVDGAVGGHQIMPGTFAQYARPGENINDPSDNAAVGKRIINDLSSKYANDPARVAVAYFSGPGNVAPAGSATPYVNDFKDGNGKSTSSYVSDVLTRLNRPLVPSKADFYRENFNAILEQTENQARVDHPDDPAYAQQAKARVEQSLNQVIRQQELQYQSDTTTIYRALSGQMTQGARPMTVDQLTSASPEAKDAWSNLQINRPEVAMEIENKLLTANSRMSSKDLQTYGPSFYNMFQRIHSDGPDKISDPAILYSHVGNDITVSGFDKLMDEMKGAKSPGDAAVTSMRNGAIAYAKHQLSFEADYGSFKIRDPAGEDTFNVQFLPAFFKAYDAGIKAGKTPFQLLDKSSPDFIVDNLVAPFKRPDSVMMHDRIAAGADASGSATNTPQTTTGTPNEAAAPDLTTREGLKKAVLSGKISRQDGIDIGIKKGWITAPAAPQVQVPAAPSAPPNSVGGQ